ncbi:MAG: amidohydrolase family protein [Blastocatellia bacterium]|nr:amidohydrolase family protein [Blastocatellia bacterium]
MKLKLFLFAFAATGLFAGGSVHAQSYAITNARIVTVSGPTIERGTVVVRNGLIHAVGANVTAPSDAQVFDGTGLTVYPGFIDSLTAVGIQPPARPAGGPGGGGGGGAAAAAAAATAQAGQSNSNYPVGLRPELAAFEDIRSNEASIEANRNAGITTVLSVGRTGIFNGQSALINLAGDSAGAMVVRNPVALHISFATIPGQYPGSLLGTFSALRQMFLDARRLDEVQKIYAADPRGIRRPDDDPSLQALIPALQRQMPVVFTANRDIEIIRALDLAKEFNLRVMIAGGQEAWKVADRLKSADATVLLSMNHPRRTTAAAPDADPEPLELLRSRAEAPKNAVRLSEAGVKYAFQSGGAPNAADYLTNAGKAVEAGLSRDAAVKAMTLSAAEIFGVDNRMGSVEAGKIANLTVVRGDPFARERVITHVFVDGQVFEPKPPATPASPGGPARPGATPGAAPGIPGATPGTPPALAAVGGNFSITIDIPGQPLTGTFALTQQGASLTGSMQTQLGTAPIRDGRVTAEGFSFTATVEFGGASIDINVRGTVTGNQITGTIDSPQGTVPFTGTRNP